MNEETELNDTGMNGYEDLAATLILDIDEADKKYGDCRSVWFRDLLTGEKCAVCGKNVTGGKSLICDECRKAIRGSMLRRCSSCGKPRAACVCTAPGMRESGSDVLLKLVGYDPAEPDYPVNRMIYRLKRRRDRMIHGYLACVMGKSLKRFLDGGEDGTADAVITYVPRAASKIRATGADQAKFFAGALSRETGIMTASLLRRLPGAKSGTQKYLDREEREKNAVSSYETTVSPMIEGATVILVDDVVTTGATLCECCRSLCDAGAKKIVSVCVARTESRRKSRPDDKAGASRSE